MQRFAPCVLARLDFAVTMGAEVGACCRPPARGDHHRVDPGHVGDHRRGPALAVWDEEPADGVTSPSRWTQASRTLSAGISPTLARRRVAESPSLGQLGGNPGRLAGAHRGRAAAAGVTAADRVAADRSQDQRQARPGDGSPAAEQPRLPQDGRPPLPSGLSPAPSGPRRGSRARSPCGGSPSSTFSGSN